MDYTVHGILRARILEWVAFPELIALNQITYSCVTSVSYLPFVLCVFPACKIELIINTTSLGELRVRYDIWKDV